MCIRDMDVECSAAITNTWWRSDAKEVLVVCQDGMEKVVGP